MSALRSISAVYRLHAVLAVSGPTIWRQVLVRSSDSLDRLHDVLRIAFGWSGRRRYVFEAGGLDYGEPEPDADIEDSRHTLIHGVLRRRGDRIDYIYDLGDEWRHHVRLDAIFRGEPLPARTLPWCEDGSLAVPPEDCGGPERFAQLFEAAAYAYATADHAGAGDADVLAGPLANWDPGAFRRSRINTRLRRLAAESRRRNSARSRHDPVPALLALIDHAMDGEPGFVPRLRARAAQILYLYDHERPGEMLRARKPETWAAGAVHAAAMSLGRSILTLETVAGCFGVSVSTLSERSVILRQVTGAARFSAVDTETLARLRPL